MDIVAPLVRAYIRAFYSDEFAIVVEPLLREPYYLEDDETPKGPLAQRFGGISSRRVRAFLSKLIEHSIVHRKDLLVKDRNTTTEASNEMNKDPIEANGGQQQQREAVGTRRFFYYIDFVHFVKVATLRASKIETQVRSSRAGSNSVTSKVYVCVADEIKLSMLDAASAKFVCTECGNPLEERDQSVEARTNKSTRVFTQAQADAFIPRFRAQMTAQGDQRDFRDNINGLLTQAHNLGPRVPANDPERELARLEVERRHREELAKRNLEDMSAIGGSMGVVVGAQQRNLADPLEWMQRTVTGSLTEAAMREAEENNAKRQRTTTTLTSDAATGGLTDADDYAREFERQRLAELQRRQEQTANMTVATTAVSPRALSGKNLEATFNFQDGSTVRAGDITEDNLMDYQTKCTTDEYDAFVEFVKANAAVDLE